MAVTPPTWLKDVVRWRWTPTVALIVGALLYVAGAMALVPSEIHFSPSPPAATGAPATGTVRDDPAADTDAATETGETATRARRKRARRRATDSEAETTTADATGASE